MKKLSCMIRLLAVISCGMGVLGSSAGEAEASWYYRRPHHEDRFGFQVTIVDGNRYYCRDGAYYRRRLSGYVLVPADEVRRIQSTSVPGAVGSTRTIVVNIPNKNGSFTPVTLQQSGNGMYIGPQGEVYPNEPTMEQLQIMYGR